jgi:hypothetical protein
MAFGQTRGTRRRTPRKLLLTSVVMVGAFAIGAALVAHHYWPFQESSVRRELQSASGAKVSFGNFHSRYFPPGCVAEHVVFHSDYDSQPVITVRRLVIRSYFGGMLHNHVSLIRAEGMHVSLSQADLKKDRSQQRVIDRLVADDAVLEVRRKSGNLPFAFHKFQVKNLDSSGPSSFDAAFENPLPAGLIRTSGQIGPWNATQAEDTPVSGKYSLEHSDLGVFSGIAGILSSSGTFRGSFTQLEVEGSATTPDLQVTKTHHELPLESRFHVTVNAISGDVVLDRVRAKFGQNQIAARGTIGHQQYRRRTFYAPGNATTPE